MSAACGRLAALAIVISVCLVLPDTAASSSGASEASGPPAGLTAYGHVLWELDALLHDTFGKRLVYLRAGDACLPANFTLAPTAVAQGGPYAFTFANASHSIFKMTRTTLPPKPAHCNSIAKIPLTIAGAYISCGRGRWLYETDLAIADEFVDCLGSSEGTPATRDQKASGPPKGLTAYGQDTWELDALLHDTFGNHPVYIRWGNPYYNTENNFTTNNVAVRSGGLFAYTFANAARSSFKLMRPKRPPQWGRGATEMWVPFTVRGAYISCSHGLWLYEPEGEPNENQFVSCDASPAPPPPPPTTTGPNTLLRAPRR